MAKFITVLLITLVLYGILGCDKPNHELNNLVARLKIIKEIKVLKDTLYLDSDQFIVYEYLDNLDTMICINRPFSNAVIKTEYKLPPTLDSCYWNPPKCHTRKRLNFIEQVKPVLCSLWHNDSLENIFNRIGVNYFIPNFPYLDFPSCVKSYRDISKFVEEGKNYSFYLWCIHDDGNCFIVIVPRFEYMEEKVLNCEDILIVRAYDQV